MPSPVIKSFSKKSGKSEAEVEKLWVKAKDVVKKQYLDVEDESDRFYEITVGILKNMLGIKENRVKSFKEFIDEKEILDERRKTIAYQLMREMVKMPSIEKVIKSHYIGDGLAIFARTTDGNAYEFVIKPAKYAKYFEKERGKVK